MPARRFDAGAGKERREAMAVQDWRKSREHMEREAIAALADGAGLRVVADLSDPLPRRHHAYFASGAAEQAKATVKWAVRAAVWRAAPRRAERLFTVHYAALLAAR